MMISSSLISILMFYVRIQIDRLMCFIDLEMFLILKKGKLYIILSIWQILIIVLLSGISVIKTSIRKIEKTQERTFRILLHDKKSLHLKRIKQIAYEVYKSLNKLNPAFMTDMFDERNISYDLRDSSVFFFLFFFLKLLMD